jgi:hypothetical protein
MVYGLLGRDVERERWLGIVSDIRGVNRAAATEGTGYGELFESIVALDRDQPERALTLLATANRGTWYGPLLSQWYSALRAEAAVLADNPHASQHCAEAERVCAGNPVATALTRRARAIAEGETETLVDLAQQLRDVGAPYQEARTLMFAGGQHRSRGEALLEELRAAPQVTAADRAVLGQRAGRRDTAPPAAPARPAP